MKRLNKDIEILLYRSIRELLINAAKHAQADLIRVSLLSSSSDIYIIVEDNGQGFDAEVFESTPSRTCGFGLFSIRERLNHICGQMKIESSEGKGTKVVLIAPFDLESGKENWKEIQI